MADQGFDVGDQPRFSAAFTVSGVATDPTTVTFKLRHPDGTLTTYVYGTDAALVKDSVGNYHVDYVVDASGAWFWGFVGTGNCKAACTGEVTVKRSWF